MNGGWIVCLGIRELRVRGLFWIQALADLFDGVESDVARDPVDTTLEEFGFIKNPYFVFVGVNGAHHDLSHVIAIKTLAVFGAVKLSHLIQRDQKFIGQRLKLLHRHWEISGVV